MPVVNLPSGQLRDEIRAPLYDSVELTKLTLNSLYGKFGKVFMPTGPDGKKLTLKEQVEFLTKERERLMETITRQDQTIAALQERNALHGQYLRVLENVTKNRGCSC